MTHIEGTRCTGVAATKSVSLCERLRLDGGFGTMRALRQVRTGSAIILFTGLADSVSFALHTAMTK
jgi:hypothetical protein